MKKRKQKSYSLLVSCIIVGVAIACSFALVLNRYRPTSPMPDESEFLHAYTELSRYAAYIPAEYAPYLLPGEKKIEVIIDNSIRFRKGKKYITKLRVSANPVTLYSTEWYERSWVGNEILASPDARVWKTFFIGEIKKETKKLVLENLPAGEYYVTAFGCVKMAVDAPCRFFRFGKRVSTQDPQPVLLDVVYEYSGKEQELF